MTALPRAALALARRHGVTRLARITGLDRLGVEVVCAIRPWGHVLQVATGKGTSLEAAAWSAVGEAVELELSEQVDPGRLRFDASGIAWVEGRSLTGAAIRPAPATAVYCPPPGTAWLGRHVARWNSNGLGFHPTRPEAALAHALLEVLERDAVARALPHGWTVEEAVRRLVAGPARRWPTGIDVFTFDLSTSAVPVAGVLISEPHGPVPLAAGYAARTTFAAAATAALLEAAQSRLTEIHGGREDVAGAHRPRGEALVAALTGLTPRPPPRHRARGVRRAAGRDAVAVWLDRRPYVVKVVAPSLLLTELV